MTPSVFDRLARRPAKRVASRIAERLGERFRCRRLRCSRRSSEGEPSNSEKCAKRPRHWLNVFTTTNRVWQFVSSLMLYGIYVHFLLNEGGESLAEQKRREAISALAPVMSLYHSNVLLINCLLRKSKSRETKGWRFVSVLTIVLDLLMMRMNLSKMNVLSSAGALDECNPPAQSFVKTLLRNGAAIAYSRLGLGSSEQDEVDMLCCLPKIVYLLCGIAIFSYTFSIFFTGLLLQRHWPSNAQAPHSGHIEEAIPSQQVQLVFVHRNSSTAPRSSFTAPRPSETVEAAPEVVAPTQTFRATRQSMSTTRSTSEDLPRYTTEADRPFPEPPVRSSMETTSSFNPDLYLVSDGFRPAPEVPAYSSRPPSFRSRPPSYMSRPSSIRNV
ncbi:hypothetical protein B0T16DRAFT_205236 [Cercophora newfieldiana]|uniref:Uncharacterized protein n=1 Tax=Cercophora newfieldiana TaxID=92897 RepID=A0AA40CJR7_9PEZI|nr:hypothetical protein B0T16DRAFT_205236 [Cercophora newfieldiana]